MTRRARVTIFLVAAAITSVFFIDFCSWVYACGCRSLWAGADSACNMHTPGVRHCPWCSLGLAGSVGVWGVIVASQAAVCFRFRRLPRVLCILGALAAFPVVGAILAVIFGWWQGYWSS